MPWTMYKIGALDTLFFRDGRPFVAGEGTDVASRFPPSPLTLQGLIRSKLLSLPSVGCTEGWRRYKDGCDAAAQPCPKHGNCEAEKVVGSVKSTGPTNGSLLLRGPWILVNECPLLPIPMDVIASPDCLKRVAQDGKGSVQTALLSPEPNAQCFSNLPGALKPLAPLEEWTEQNVKFEGVPGFISWDRYKEYLCGTAPKLTLKEDWWRPLDLWGDELRPGLEIEDERSRAKQGMLYFARHTRLARHVSIGVELSGLGNLEQSMNGRWRSPFGGERRAVVVEPMQPARNPWAEIDPQKDTGEPFKRIRETGRLKLVMTQTAWFQDGWIPAGWDKGDQTRPATAKWNGETATWIAARMERPESIGGWDLAKGDQKPVRRFVPAGAVYYLKADQGNDQAIQAWLGRWNESISQTPNGEPFEYSHLGLGQVFVGTW